MENRFYRLIEYIRQKFDCEARWLRSEHVHDEWQGATVWDGDVQVFVLRGHPEALIAYAWSYQTRHGRARIHAILNEGAIRCAGDAVRASVVAGSLEEDQPWR